jgi:tRNA (guanine-N7-)-methyltransferase
MYWNFSGVVKDARDARFSDFGGPLLVEIGFGNGEYLAYLAKTRPGALVIGMEVSAWCVAKAVRRALAEGAANIRALRGDARYLLRYAFEPDCVSEIFMNFPCPWPKRRHSSRRVAGEEFAREAASRLKIGGAFTLATDVEWFAHETRGFFAANTALSAGPVERIPARVCATKYERKWRSMGRDIFQTRAEKVALCGVQTETTGDEGYMNELEIITARDAREKIASLEGESIETEGYKVIFREIFFGDGSALAKVISVDEGFEQHYYIKITFQGGKPRARVDSVGYPYKTPGVRASLRYVADRMG